MTSQLAKDEVGNRYYSLMVIDRVESVNGYARFLCKCDCGNESIVRGSDLRSGNTKSCGKCKREWHGDSASRLYNIWCHMKRRTENPQDAAYEDYGGRGIAVCDEWNKYSAFKEWAISNGYNDSLTIERIDVNSGYYPSNCKWIPVNEQAKNRRSCHFITIKNETKCVSEWAKEFGIKPRIVLERMRSGWSAEDALFAPIMPRRKHEKQSVCFDGIKLSQQNREP